MPLHNPKWLKALGLLYESAYADLFNHSGVHLLNSAFSKEVNRPLHAPPRLLSLSVNEIIVRDDGTRTQSWLKEHGFEGIASMAGHWMHRSSNPQTILLITRQFLEEFPYVENRLMFDSLSDVDRRAITEGIELYWVLWDSHGFWNLNKI